MKENIHKLLRERLNEFHGEESIVKNPRTKMYHGGPAGITLDNLTINRTDSLIKGKNTGSSNTGSVGFYLAPRIWINEGGETAEKYALWATKSLSSGEKVCIYEVILEPNIYLSRGEYDNINPNSKEWLEYQELMKNGIAGLQSSGETVIWDKSKIKSITPLYFANKFKQCCGLPTKVKQCSANDSRGWEENKKIIDDYFKKLNKGDYSHRKYNNIDFYENDYGTIKCLTMSNMLDWVKI